MITSASNQHKHYRFLGFFALLALTFLDLGVLFQDYLVQINRFYFSATIFVYPLSCICFDIIAEIYGYQLARKTLWLIIFTNFLFGGAIRIVALLPAPAFWQHYTVSFQVATSPVFDSLINGLIGILFGQFINLYAITKMKVLVNGRYFALRSVSSTIIGDTITVIISLLLDFITQTTTAHVVTIIVTELLIMYVFAAVLSVPGAFVTRVLKKIEGDSSNVGVNFNPFSMKVD